VEPRERDALLRRYLSDPDGDVFALTGLPEVVKGALFARYSRSPASVKDLLVDEFAADVTDGDPSANADRLYARVFGDYGDDSVAQLGGAHVALEGISNVATKRIEWGRLAAYLEQSTRYVAYDQRVAGRYRYHREAAIMAGPHAQRYERVLDGLFDTYAAALPEVTAWVRDRFPRDPQTSERAWQAATRAKGLDLLRGLLPAATTANVGMFASGQAYEALLLRLAADPLAEPRELGARLLRELRTVIPSFVARVDRPDRGGAWSDYLATVREDTRGLAQRHVIGPVAPVDAPVTLVDWWPRDPVDAEVSLVVGALLPHVEVSEGQLEAQVRTWPAEQRAEVLRAYVGDRANRRHRPGRAFERVVYRFDILGDYGGFRDLQRHRMCTIEWQEPTTIHGYDTPPELVAAGVADVWHAALGEAEALHRDLLRDHPREAQYVVPFAFRIRYGVQINARAAMQMLELRSTPQGHPQYRAIVQAMHRAIAEVAGHRAVADAMVHVDHGAGDLERLASERALDARRVDRGASGGDGTSAAGGTTTGGGRRAEH
jgi:thymidylate synthase ThyX